MDLKTTDASTQQKPKQMDEEFTTTAYPNVQETSNCHEDQIVASLSVLHGDATGRMNQGKPMLSKEVLVIGFVHFLMFMTVVILNLCIATKFSARGLISCGQSRKPVVSHRLTELEDGIVQTGSGVAGLSL
ncbi:hypothetical protein Tco_1334634 [Tanacetum coccineum]